MGVTLAEIYQPIRSELKATEALLLRELALRDGLLGEMTRYIARMPGKRIRPALALLGAGVAKTKEQTRRGQTPQQQGSDPVRSDSAVRLAAAVEMIHTATLLHDDVIDEADLRRGLSTLNAKWGDTLSVLSGDYLYSKAFCLLSELGSNEVLSLMSATARTICEGEVAQIQHRYDLTLSIPKYLKIIRFKTASLMGASAKAGALLAGASANQTQALGTFGLNFGMAFQIIDDAQDLVGEETALGKSLGTDFGQGQMTLPLIYLRQVGHSRIRNTIAHWFHGDGTWAFHAAPGASPVRPRSNGAKNPFKQEQLSFLKRQALKHEVPRYCRKVASRYLAKARRALGSIPPSVYKASLLSLTDYLLKN